MMTLTKSKVVQKSLSNTLNALIQENFPLSLSSDMMFTLLPSLQTIWSKALVTSSRTSNWHQHEVFPGRGVMFMVEFLPPRSWNTTRVPSSHLSPLFPPCWLGPSTGVRAAQVHPGHTKGWCLMGSTCPGWQPLAMLGIPSDELRQVGHEALGHGTLVTIGTPSSGHSKPEQDFLHIENTLFHVACEIQLSSIISIIFWENEGTEIWK